MHYKFEGIHPKKHMTACLSTSAPLQVFVGARTWDQPQPGCRVAALVGFENHQELLFVGGLQQCFVLFNLFHEFVGHADRACAPVAVVDRITDFGLKGGTGAGQGSAEADVIDLSLLLKGYSNTSTLNDFVRAANVGGKVQIQVDIDGKANNSGFEQSWFMTLDSLSVNNSNEVLVNGSTVAATAAGLSGNLTVDTLVRQMVADSQFKLL